MLSPLFSIIILRCVRMLKIKRRCDKDIVMQFLSDSNRF